MTPRLPPAVHRTMPTTAAKLRSLPYLLQRQAHLHPQAELPRLRPRQFDAVHQLDEAEQVLDALAGFLLVDLILLCQVIRDILATLTQERTQTLDRHPEDWLVLSGD